MTTPDVRPPESDDELYAAFVGRNWERHYRASFRAAAERGRYTFNWAAALVPMWLASRGFVSLQLVAFFLSLVAVLVYDKLGYARVVEQSDYPVPWFVQAVVVFWVVGGAIEGAAADWLVHHRAIRAIKAVRTKGLGGDAAALAVSKARGAPVLDWLGVPVVLVAGTLSLGRLTSLCACGDNKYWDRAHTASMKADLRNLVTAEESYFTDDSTYTATIGNLEYSQSAGNTVSISSANSTGWAATAKNNGTTKTCGIYVGSATAPITGQSEGEPKCK